MPHKPAPILEAIGSAVIALFAAILVGVWVYLILTTGVTSALDPKPPPEAQATR